MRLSWKLPLERLSASSLGLFIQCPEQFRQKYLLKTEDKNFGSRFIGSVDHAMSAVLSAEKMAGVVEPDINMLYHRTWNERLEKDGEPDWRDDDPVKMFKRGVAMSQLYWNEVTSKIVPVAVEERVEFTIPGIPSKMVGYVDTMESHVIRERKTTAVKTTKPKPKWRFQGLIYQYATGMPVRWDVITRQATPQLFLAEEHENLYLPVGDPAVTRQLLRDAAKRMNDLYAQYGSDNTWPMEGLFGDWLCDYCPIGPKYKRSCPAWNQTTL